jgi:hypothetical protein
MSERRAAEIWIGGIIQPELVHELCAAIRGEQLSLAWGDAVFEPRDADELLEGLGGLDGVEVLYFCDDRAACGQFAELEEFLRKRRLPYDRRSGASDCYDGALAQYRPGRKLTETTTNANGYPVVDADAVEQALILLTKAQQSLKRGKCVRSQLGRATKLLAGALPPDLPRLPPFAIASGKSKRVPHCGPGAPP